MTLVHRPHIYNYGYPYEFLNKMSEDEVKNYFNEVRKQLNDEEIPTTNINRYNKVFKSFLQEREEIYQVFKENSVCSSCNDTLLCYTVEDTNCEIKNKNI